MKRDQLTFGSVEFTGIPYEFGRSSNYHTVPKNYFKKITQEGKNENIHVVCDYHYTDDYAYDNANNCGQGSVSIDWLYDRYNDWYALELRYEEKNGIKEIGVRIHSNLHYTITETLAFREKALQEPKKEDPEPKPQNKQQPANNDKLQHFAQLFESDRIHDLINKNLACDANIIGVKVKIVSGKQYTKVDVGTSGAFMVDEAGNIYGIKAYGVIHKGHYFGTLDTVDNFYWGFYRGYMKRNAKHPTEILSADQVLNERHPNADANKVVSVDFLTKTKIG